MKKTLLITAMIALFTACEKHEDDDHKHDEGEVINQVKLTVTSTDSMIQTVTWTDEDGLGGQDPTLPDTLRLKMDSTYSVNIGFFHLHDGSLESVNEEILSESVDHIVCYNTTHLTSVISVISTITDKDANDLPLGLSSSWLAVSPITTNMRIALKHQPGIKNGNCEVGETDVEVEFPLIIK
jgi:hypothetical protein